MKLKSNIVYLRMDDKQFTATRLHGFEYNQPVRITYPDYAAPNVIVVLQVYMDQDLKDKLRTSKLYLQIR